MGLRGRLAVGGSPAAAIGGAWRWDGESSGATETDALPGETAGRFPRR